jgi:FixJ family two-component response regulator
VDPARPKVFIVDDDESVRRSLGRLLQSAGYDAELFDGSDAYLSRSAPDRPACLLLDMRMPGTTGMELQRRIAGTCRDVPVVFITGHGDDVSRTEALASGAVDVLFKPLDGFQLLETIERALKLSTSREATPFP